MLEFVQILVAVLMAVGPIQAILERRRRARMEALLELIDKHANSRAERYVAKLEDELLAKMHKVAEERDTEMLNRISDRIAGR